MKPDLSNQEVTADRTFALVFLLGLVSLFVFLTAIAIDYERNPDFFRGLNFLEVNKTAIPPVSVCVTVTPEGICVNSAGRPAFGSEPTNGSGQGSSGGGGGGGGGGSATVQ